MESPAEEVIKLLNREADMTIECSGAPSSVELAIRATRPGGKVILCGLGARYQQIPLSIASMREIDLMGLCRFANCYQSAIELIDSGRYPNMKKMITHIYQLDGNDDIGPLTAFKTLQETQSGDGRTAVKVLIKCQP